jgi:hypothetical protein
MTHEPQRQAERRFDLAADVRKFEIGLFWTRSLFFWGFISVAFAGYAALANADDHLLALLVGCFGLVCSVAWSLVNRGSKYWQEAWEQKTENQEWAAYNTRMFRTLEPVLTEKGPWLRARRFSVSKTTIALSDFTIGIWIISVAVVLPWARLTRGYFPVECLIPLATIVYIIAMLFACRSTDTRNEEPQTK